jgi:[protein-PII] uridylyltransferase
MANDLRAQRESLEDLWQKGLSGRALLGEHTRLVDRYLAQRFDAAFPTAPLSLVALGGYGRRELFPFSDIDLMLLHDNVSQKVLDEAAAVVFYPLWDAGLEVGHGVRTPEGCLADVVDDYFFRVALLDARPVAGSRELFDNLIRNFQKTFIDGNRKDFLEKMQHHRQERHRRFGMHTYLLEPHIKESRGGLRDVQSMLWTSKVVFGINDITGMEDAALLSSSERLQFEKAWDFLIKIRNRLHYISGRKNDQLFFEHQEEMATAFAYQKKNGMLEVEHFMRDVHEAMQAIAVTGELFFEHVDEVLGVAAVGERALADEELEAAIMVRLNRLHLLDEIQTRQKPIVLMRLFYQAARTGLQLHHRTRKMVQNLLPLIDNRFRRSRRITRTFLEVLRQPYAAEALTFMLETGVLDTYLPEFKQIVSLAQHDIYHVNTVDRHLLQTVRELQRVVEQEPTIAAQVRSISLLYLAALLHDIGKGQEQGHTERGAALAREIADRIGLSEEERDLLGFIVEQHLLLMNTALRRDLEDEGMILRCAEQIKNPERLSMLYLVTVADAKATGPTVWNEWKGALLLELYLKIAHLLDREDLGRQEVDQRQAADWMIEQVRRELGSDGLPDAAIMPPDYLTSFSPPEIARHIRLKKCLGKRKLLVETAKDQGCWSVLIMTGDRPGLLARICGVLALHNLRILSAQIFTWTDGTVVDVLLVDSTIGGQYEEQNWQRLEGDLQLAVRQQLGLDYRLHKKLEPLGRRKQQVKHRLPTRVEIDNDASDSYSIIEVYAADRIGLLYEIARTLTDFGMNISRAIIGSKADQVVDVFYVQDYEGKKVEEPVFQEEIRKGLLHAATHESRERRDL